MRYRYLTVDVFTERRFGGNPLAVLPQAEGLDGERMQRIAREFNYSESTFVLPAREPDCARRVRVFTPMQEVPFAGHPNVGTAFVLAALGELEAPPEDGETEVAFEEAAGRVPIRIRWRAGKPESCELTAPKPLAIGKDIEPDKIAAATGLSPRDLVTEHHRPCVAGVGLPLVFAEVRDRAALARARPVDVGPDDLASLGAVQAPGIHLYTRDADPETDLQTRMFAPAVGVPEDPATGSANCALGALLAALEPADEGEFRYRIAQGVEMGRPSRLAARAFKSGGKVHESRIGGGCVPVCDGSIEIDT